MLEKEYGRIINMGSFAGRGMKVGSSAYAVSKAALTTLSKAIAEEVNLNSYPDVLINELVPGSITRAIPFS